MSDEYATGSRRVYSGRIIEVFEDRPPGWPGAASSIELVRHPGAAAVVGLRGGEVVLVRQHRHAVRADLLEIPAGKLDVDGETPEQCAAREFEEETGFSSGPLMSLGFIHTSPGFADEVVHLFMTEVLPGGGEGGSEGEVSGEVSEVMWVPFDRALEMIDAGEITDAKTIAGLLIAARRSGQA